MVLAIGPKWSDTEWTKTVREVKMGETQMKLRVPANVHAALKAAAERQQRSMNWLVNKVLAEAVEKLQGAKP
jgi:predicted HicB family RNase H-like nuclease